MEDPPGIVRPLTPPATGRKEKGRRKTINAADEQRSTTFDGFQVAEPGLSRGNGQDGDRAMKLLDTGRGAHDDGSEPDRAFSHRDLEYADED